MAFPALSGEPFPNFPVVSGAVCSCLSLCLLSPSGCISSGVCRAEPQKRNVPECAGGAWGPESAVFLLWVLHPPFSAPGVTPLLSLSAVLWAGSLLLILDGLPMLFSLLHLPSQVCVGVSNVSWVEFLSPSCSCLQLIFDKRRGWKVCSAI